jgi:hypothetical protein
MSREPVWKRVWNLRLAAVTPASVPVVAWNERHPKNATDERPWLLSQGGSGSGDGERRTVRAGRRRRGTSGGDRERAETPRRERPSSSQRPAVPRPSGQRPTGSLGGGQLPVGQIADVLGGLLRGRKVSPLLLIGGLAFLCICAVLAMLLLRGDGLGGLATPTPADVGRPDRSCRLLLEAGEPGR